MRLREERRRDVSIEDLHFEAKVALKAKGAPWASLSTVQKALAKNSTKGATTELIQTLAAALDVAPEEFPEYRLALARRELDEREVGLDQAVAMLTQIEAALRRPRRGAGREAGPAQASPGPSRASRTAGRTRRAG